MSIAPFATPRVPTHAGPPGSWWRTRLAVVSATVGIAATLLAYAISPGLRHAVVHAERSVRHAVSHVFDKDAGAREKGQAARRARSAHGRASATSTHSSSATSNRTAPKH
jgi:hypothetical protein